MFDRQKTILVVDDTPVDAGIIAAALKDVCKTTVATNGERALALAKGAHKPDLILLDVVMAGLDGHEVCRRLKRDQDTRDIPVIFLTGRTDVEAERKGFDLGAVDYIHKPFSAPIVQARVATHLTLQGALKQSRELAKQLLSANEDLERKIAAALQREQANQAELAMATRFTTMGVLTASIAHEINQPIAALVANSGAAQRWLSAASPDLSEVRAALKRIAADSHRVGQVVSSLKSMFKQNDGEHSPLIINDVLREVIELLRGAMLSGGVVARTDLLEEIPRVLGNRTQLQQVLINLITNAVDAMEAVVDRERVLTIRSRTIPDKVVIEVEDSGVGIPPENLGRLFDAFFTTKFTGMGIGLSICQSIIESHGGRLRAANAVPFGSILCVELPAADSGVAIIA